MTEQEKVTKVKNILENDSAATDSVVINYLEDAAYAIYQRLYPYDLPETPSVPAIYERLQCKLASRYFLRRGAEGEMIHDENGIRRTYGSVNDEDLLMEITPYACVHGDIS